MLPTDVTSATIAANLDRKDSHLQICLEEGIEFYSPTASGFASFRFEHDALPEINKSEIDLSVTLFGKKLDAPLFIGAMTGGTEHAALINRRLAEAAAFCQVGMSLGSQRKMLESPITRASFDVKKHAPTLPLLVGNIGAVQLNYGATAQQIAILIESIQCDAFNFHLNPLQESIQPEGDTNFSGLMNKLSELIPNLKIPVIIKEVGSGISRATARKIKTLPVAGIETAGVGGTSWSKIESLRANNTIQKSTGEMFARWGTPTPESIIICRDECPDLTVLASGGLRSGIEVAKALALGADAAGMALPFLKAAEQSTEAVVEAIEKVLEELRVVMFLTGSANVSELKSKTLLKALDLTAVE